MDTIILSQNILQNVTIISNDFIDQHMLKADGEYVKIYLLILRLTNQNISVTPDLLADKLELTRKDVLRAIRYWKKEGLLSVQKEGKTGSGSTPAVFTPDSGINAAVPEKHTYSASELQKHIQDTDLERLVFMAETYIGHPLSVQELNSICYISKDLHFSTDLLEYLVEYCSERGKKQIRYMEKVAINWYEAGIDTVKAAMDQSALYTRNVFSVMKAFGISGRNPGQSEIDFISRWNSMGFESDIIVEACNRTLLATHQASFPYANRILEDWKKAGVKNISDIRSMDKKHHARTGTEDHPPVSGTGRAGLSTASNSFHNFDQRSYDYDALELRLAGKTRR